MTDREEDEDRQTMGRLIDDDFEHEIRINVRSMAVSLRWPGLDLSKPVPGVHAAVIPKTGIIDGSNYRAFHGRWYNVHRGERGSATFARNSGWTDYIDGTGRFHARNDVIVTAGDDRELFAAAINASKQVARKYNDAVMLGIRLPLPRHLSVQGLINIMEGLYVDVHSSGRLCTLALHDAPDRSRGNIHVHLRATGRPVLFQDGNWLVGKGKFISDRDAMIEWRKRFAAIVNRELDREAIPDTSSPRYHHGTHATLGIPGFAKRRVSAAAVHRDDPDRSRPEDQFNLEYNRAIDEGRDPNEDPHVVEERQRLARIGAEKRAKKGG